MLEINFPTAEKQDSIKKTVENIESNFPMEINGGTDLSEFYPFSKTSAITFTSNNINQWHTAVDIEGSGYFTRAVVGCDTLSMGRTAHIQIFADDKLIYDAVKKEGVSDRLVAGLIRVEDIITIGTSRFVHMVNKTNDYRLPPSSSFSQFPKAEGELNAYVAFLSQPIFFKSRLQLKIKTQEASQNYNFNVDGALR